MSNYSSKEQIIEAPVETVYAKISDLSNLNTVKDKVPEGKLQNIRIEKDTLALGVPGYGDLELAITEKVENNYVKYGSVKSPFPFSIEIRLKGTDEAKTSLVVCVDADIPFFIKPMIDKPLKEALEKISEYVSHLK